MTGDITRSQNDCNNDRRHYTKPTMRFVELQHSSMLLQASPVQQTGDPTFNGFNEEQEW